MAPRRMSAILKKIERFVRAPAFAKEAAAASVTRIALDGDPYAVLVSTIVSLRTRDAVTDAVTPRLLALAPNAAALARAPAKRIAKAIYPACFYNVKGRTLRKLGKTLVDDHGGEVPSDLDALLALDGVGRKTANLVVTLGFGTPGICVDTHVHRIANRLGMVRTDTPDETEHALRRSLPKRWWIPINDLLVLFGQRHCTPLSPRCSTCPVRDACARRGVGRAR